jgi:ketosteroid isomerase-like protein
MSNHRGICFARRTAHKVILLLLVSALSLICVSPATAQKEKKKKPDSSASADSSKSLATLTDEQQIDYTLSEMLGAWQVGDVEKLHKNYGDDVAIVNGSWAPPILGWSNYLSVYQQQLTRMQKVRMDRSNTYIRVSGTVGWACYQWEFVAVVDGQESESHGQSTVVLEKRNNHWVIVLNHTSLAPMLPQPAPPAPTGAPSGRQQPGKGTSR